MLFTSDSGLNGINGKENGRERGNAGNGEIIDKI